MLTISGAYMYVSPLPHAAHLALSLNFSSLRMTRSTCGRRVLVSAYQFGGEEGKDWEFKPVEFEKIKSPEWL